MEGRLSSLKKKKNKNRKERKKTPASRRRKKETCRRKKGSRKKRTSPASAIDAGTKRVNTGKKKKNSGSTERNRTCGDGHLGEIPGGKGEKNGQTHRAERGAREQGGSAAHRSHRPKSPRGTKAIAQRGKENKQGGADAMVLFHPAKKTFRQPDVKKTKKKKKTLAVDDSGGNVPIEMSPPSAPREIGKGQDWALCSAIKNEANGNRIYKGENQLSREKKKSRQLKREEDLRDRLKNGGVKTDR